MENEPDGDIRVAAFCISPAAVLFPFVGTGRGTLEGPHVHTFCTAGHG